MSFKSSLQFSTAIEKRHSAIQRISSHSTYVLPLIFVCMCTIATCLFDMLWTELLTCMDSELSISETIQEKILRIYNSCCVIYGWHPKHIESENYFFSRIKDNVPFHVGLTIADVQICDELDLYDPLRLNPGTMRRFISRIEDQYRNNPYHNRQHAATVTLTMYQILVHSGTPDEWQGTNQVKLYHLAAILAAAVHDVGHPGVGNDFRVRTVRILRAPFKLIVVYSNTLISIQ